MPTPVLPRPADATLSVTKAAQILGVHANTIRAWSDAGRLRYYRINRRGDRRYRIGDLRRFLAAAEFSPGPDILVHRPEQDRGRRRQRPAPTGAGPEIGRDAAARTPADGGGERLHGETAEGPAVAGVLELNRLTALLVGIHPVATEVALAAAARAIRTSLSAIEVGIYATGPSGLELVGAADAPEARLADLPAAGLGVAGRAIRSGRLEVGGQPRISPGRGVEAAIRLGGPGASPGGVLVATFDRPPDSRRRALISTLADATDALLRVARGSAIVAARLHRSEALRRATGDLGARLDLADVLGRLVDHALILFRADRAAVYLRRPDGHVEAEVARGLSAEYLAAVRAWDPRSLAATAAVARRPAVSLHSRETAGSEPIRAAILQAGFETTATAPLFAGAEFLGMLDLHHDLAHRWSDEDLATLEGLAVEAGQAIRTAMDYARMATWTAQLQSIQQLGTRLARLTNVGEIGLAIASELRQLIDYHNVRVYALHGDDLVPVAMQGQVGAYVDETPEQLRVKVGEGITGWVARHRVAQSLPDAARDPRASTIPGTADDLDESMLLAPMLFDDQVLGVLVLSKLGLHQFGIDDLRLLTIYASFAAQAMANAETTERLRAQTAALARQLRSQRELLNVTESILTSLDPKVILERIAERLGEVVAYDNISIEVYDRAARRLRPVTARGIHAADYLAEWEEGEAGLATWVIEHDEPVLVLDEAVDPRVRHFETTGPIHGSLIVVPLRGRDGVSGVLTVERLDPVQPFGEDEFELVKLFAAQVSIALQNAEVYSAVEVRARTDDLTGLLNHGTFQEWLARSIQSAEPFSLIMLDLDDFRGVNNELGHQAGDRLLREIAAALIAAGRDSDLVFRYGGDEFCYLLPGTDAVGARQVAERALRAVAGLTAPGTAWAAAGAAVTASVGYATFPGDGDDPAGILLAADRAAFVVKRRGGHGIATAREGVVLGGEFHLQEPTPVDPPSVPVI